MYDTPSFARALIRNLYRAFIALARFFFATHAIHWLFTSAPGIPHAPQAISGRTENYRV